MSVAAQLAAPADGRKDRAKAADSARPPLSATLSKGTCGMKNKAGSLRRQLNRDLLLAMKAKDAITISALRSLLSALDNATAVPASTVLDSVFGRNDDVSRENLSDTIHSSGQLRRHTHILWARSQHGHRHSPP